MLHPYDQPDAKFKFLTKQQVLALIPVTGPTLWNWVRAGKFPKPRELASNKTVWFEHEVMAWIQARPVLQYGTKSKKKASMRAINNEGS